MKLLIALSELFNIRSGEGRLVLLFIVHSFFIGLTRTFTETANGTLFLQNYSAADLPYMYILSTIVIAIVGLIYSRLERRLSFTTLMVVNLVGTFAAIVILRLLFEWTDERWPALVLAIWFELMWVLNSLEFWGLAGRVFEVRQAKRLYGLIGSGEVVAAIVGGLAASALVRGIGTLNLLIIGAAGVIVSIIVMFSIVRSTMGDVSFRSLNGTEERAPIRKLFQSRYIVLIFILAAFTVTSLYFLDNAFYTVAEQQFPNDADLASFLGVFLAIGGVFQFISRTFLAGTLINRYGVVAGLLALPLALTVGAVSVVAAAQLAGPVMLVFWFVVVTKLLDKGLRYTVNQSANLVLYQPLPTEQRLSVQTVSESIVEAIAGIIAGIFLLVLNQVFSFSAVQLMFASVFVLLVWMIIITLLNREYKNVLVDALSGRRLGRAALTLDGSGMAILTRSLQSEHPGEVIYALNMLEAAEHDLFEPFLTQLLNHPAPEVRTEVLNKIEQHRLISALPAVSARASAETVPVVLGRLLRTLSTLGETEVLEQVIPFLDHENVEIRMGAMVGLLRSGGIEGVLVAGEKAISLEHSESVAEREVVARLLGEVGIQSFYRPLLNLLKDDHPRVRRAAVLAAGKVQNPKLWPLLIENLDSAAVGAAAVATLAAGGDTILPLIDEAFYATNQTQLARIRLVRTLGRIRSPEAVERLRRKIDFSDDIVRYQVLMALWACNFNADADFVPHLLDLVNDELAGVSWTITAIEDLQGDESMGMVVEALENELHQTRRRILYLLSFIYDTKSMAQVLENVFHQSRQRRAYALEILDVQLSQELKTLILPLFDDTSAEQLPALFSEHFPQEHMPTDDRFKQLLLASKKYVFPWTKVCGLYIVPSFDRLKYTETVVEVLKDNPHDSLVGETALWTLYHIAPGLYRLFVQRKRDTGEIRISKDATTGGSSILERTITQIEREIRGGRKLLLTIEKVIILKTVSIFSETPDDLLAEIASILEEEEVRAGETIIRKGDIGDHMYIIAGGEMRVHDGDRTIAILGEREVVGELALLDSEPRNASVTATQDSLLLKLNQDAFFELVADYPDVVRGIIRVLTRRLRTMSAGIPTG